MKKIINDGWHTVHGYEVYIKNSRIVRGLSLDGQRTVYIYRRSRSGGLDRVDSMTLAAFNAAWRRGTVTMA